jgi:hypothetical protein
MGFPGTNEKGDLEDLNAERSYEAMRVHMNTVAVEASQALGDGYAGRFITASEQLIDRALAGT